MTSKAVAYRADEIFDGMTSHHGAALIVADGVVQSIVPSADIPAGLDIRDVPGGLIAPGFVDLQVNGGGGLLLNDAPTVETIATICAAHARFGSTALMVTLITAARDVTEAAIAAARDAAAQAVPGFAGLHLEGPHLSLSRKGAHHESLIRPMSAEDRDLIVRAAGDLPSLKVTLAPENATVDDITALREAGVLVSLGHTDAGYAAAAAAVEAGATAVTHLFNAMSGLHHREPGLVGAALDLGSVSAGLIADGYHVVTPVIRAALAAKRGPGRIYLVTDAMWSIGSDDDVFLLDGREVRRANGILTLADGTLAGADLDMMAAVRFMTGEIGVGRDEALRMAALYPADVLGRPELGRLSAGARADFVHIDDNLHVVSTWIGGNPAT